MCKASQLAANLSPRLLRQRVHIAVKEVNGVSVSGTYMERSPKLSAISFRTSALLAIVTCEAFAFSGLVPVSAKALLVVSIKSSIL